MKTLFLGALIALTCVSACTNKSNNTNELVLGTHAAYPPYESVDANGEIVGFDIDVAKAVAQKLNKKLVVKDMSFDALVLALKQKKFDIIMAGISITPSREKEIAFVPYQGEALTSLSLLFWNNVLQNSTDLKKMGDKTIAVQTGTFMENYLNKFSNITPKALDGTVELITDLKHGKSAAALVEPHIATSVMLQHPQLKRVEIALPKDDWVLGNGIGVHKEDAALISDVQKAIELLKQEGVIQKLETKWFGK
jgi:ABC-type amino acid transport substrate-binding protein